MCESKLDGTGRMAAGPQPTRGFTLRELLVTVVAGALLILVLAPSLHAAAGRSRTEVCLCNLRSLGVAVRLCAEEYNGVLPGPVHTAVYHEMLHDDDDPAYQYLRERTLPWKLRVALGTSITDRLITCPVMSGVVPDSHFERFHEVTGKQVYPTHYALNNYAPYGIDTRPTNPPDYFGALLLSGRPVAIGAVPNAEREWMIADAWYRPRANPAFLELQQEGPFQTAWTGEALPNFAPHERRGSCNYSFIDSATRAQQSARIQQSKSDGITNTLFFDGHAASVPSRTYTVADVELLYGFRGTVNPAQIDPPPDSPAWDGVWR